MATTPVTINIDNTLITEALNALCAQGGYSATIPDPQDAGQTIANPVTKAAFAKQVIRDYVRNAVYEQRNRAAQAANQPVDPTLIS